MTRRIEPEYSYTVEIIDDLFSHPPVNEAELKQRLYRADPTVTRRLIIDRLNQNDLPDWAGPLFLAVLGHLGLGRQKRRLTSIALDLNRDSRARLWAAMALTSDDPKVMDYLVNELGPDGMGILAELSLFELLTMQDPDEIGPSIVIALEDLLDEKPAEELLSRIESCRHGVGASCSTAYGEALRNESIAFVRPKILDLFVQEASDEGIELLVSLRDQALTDEARRDFQAALLRLRSRRIDPEQEQEQVKGYALVSNCDGQGNFVVLGVFENPDGTTSVADISIRADGDIRDGVIYPRRHSTEVEEFAGEVQHNLGCFFVEVSLAEAAELVAAGVRRTLEQGQKTPEDARHAVTLFERVVPGFRWGDGSCCQAAPRASTKQVRELLERPEYDDTWFFDQGDRLSSGIEQASGRKAPSEWVNKASERLERTPIRSRLIAMAEHMARWHYWNDESNTSALLRAIALDARQQFAQSTLVRVMLERSAEATGETAMSLTHQFCDPAERQHYKMLFFQDTKAPTGLDLARLDMTEAAASALSTAFVLLPGEQRPRDEEKDAAAYAIGKVFADKITTGELPRPEHTVSEMSRALAGACRLSESERHEVLMTVVPTLYAFVEDICAVCSINCLKRRDDDMSEVFFTLDHPMAFEEK